MKEFTVRSYPKSELALLYFPDADPHVTLNRLNSWIPRCRDLPGVHKDCPCYDVRTDLAAIPEANPPVG